ncbi:MAG: cytotoxin [bacterium]
MFQIIPSNRFKSIYKKLIKNNKILEKQIDLVLMLIEINPKDQRLKTHKVNTNDGIMSWSSRVNGNIRIIWNYGKDNHNEIRLLKIGGHSGKDKVYN